MADFKIDRIRFKWKGDWLAGTQYVKDDIVRYGAKVYTCIEVHIADSNFYNDLDNATPKWSLTMSGQSWTGNWQPNKFYKIGEVAKVGATLYQATQGHLSNADANNGILGDESKWEYFARGEKWTSTWLPNTLYSVGETVVYGGSVWKCIIAHTSSTAVAGLESHQAKWTQYHRSDNYRGYWTPNTRYYPDDITRYGGTVYRAVAGHTSAPTDNWTGFTSADYVTNSSNGVGAIFNIFKINSSFYAKFTNTGTNFAAANTITIVGSKVGGADGVNDVVITVSSVDGGGAISTFTVNGTAVSGNNGLEADQVKWQTVIEGIDYIGHWAEGTKYNKGSLVSWSPGIWKVTTDHWSITPQMNETNFSLWVPGAEYEGSWDTNKYYQKGDVVQYGGYSYSALVSNTNIVPGVTDSTNTWELLQTGYNHRGEWDSTTAYKTGDVVRAGGNLFIAVQANTNDDPVTTFVYDPGSDAPDPWQLLVTGVAFKGPWKESDTNGAITYYVGDVVTEKADLYRCITTHVATSSDAKPTLDEESENVGPLWVRLAQGATSNILEIDGDLKSHSGSEDTRIAIGSFGQLFKVNDANDYGVWGDHDVVAKVFYVSPYGEDKLTSGKGVAGPFRTIKYACDFVQQDLANRTPATIIVKTGVYEEILPITVPAKVHIWGDFTRRGANVRPKTGYEGTDMWRLRDATGLANITMQGLTGSLDSANAYGTKRPTGGAYVSLDPGSGPGDGTVWITSKSPYIKNCSIFGTGCTGLKVDGDLHNGGYKSFVANDCTHFIENGVAAWVNGDARVEFVSVFAYWAHIGYLATAGGKFRATNGNCSYGDFGAVAEGLLASESPLTGKVNNQSQEAHINKVYNDENEIFAFAFDHAGQDYTSASITIAGSGEGAAGAIRWPQIRQGAVNKIRVTGNNDSTVPGGTNYTEILGNAQIGTNKEITLAPQYEGTTNNTVGQRIYIWEGAGRGQYGYISGYNSTTKVATVKKEFDDTDGWQHFMGGYPIEPLLDASTKYSIEPRITISPTAGSRSNVSYGSTGEMLLGASGKIGASDITALIGNGVGNRTSDGTNWLAAGGIPSKDWNSITKTTNYFVATAADGTLIRSGDGTSWTDISANIPSDVLRASAYDVTENILIVASETGMIYRSTDEGATFTSIQVELYDGSTPVFTQMACGNGLFIGANTTGQTWESMGGGTTWTKATNMGDFLMDTNSGLQTVHRYNLKKLMFGGGKFIASVQDAPGDESTVANKFLISNANAAQSQTSSSYSWTESDTPPHAGPYTDVAYSQGVYIAITDGGDHAYSFDAYSWKQLDSALAGTYNGIVGGRNTAGGYFIPLRTDSQSGAEKILKGATPLARVVTNSSAINNIQILDPGSGYSSEPTVTITDNLNTADATFKSFVHNGVLSQPEFTNRGTGFINVTATLSGDGFADEYQTGSYLEVKEMTGKPGPGAILYIDGIDDQVYRITQINKITGSSPNIAAQFRVTPKIKANESPAHDVALTIREKYSQVRLTGHDFLDVGTGNKSTTNYPGLYTSGYTPGYELKQRNETVSNGGGRVFYTSTDQDGNYRVGELFEVEQATGIVTLNADLFNLSGLTELSLGGIVIGGTEVKIEEFSTDGTMAANSDSVIPTQRAISLYIGSKVSGGGANLSTNEVRAGQIKFKNDEIYNEAYPTNGKIEFTGAVSIMAVSGSIIATSYFLGAGPSEFLNEGGPERDALYGE